MLELIDRADERQRLSAAAAAVAKEKYSRESYLRRTAEAYRRLSPDYLRSGEPLGSSSTL